MRPVVQRVRRALRSRLDAVLPPTLPRAVGAPGRPAPPPLRMRVYEAVWANGGTLRGTDGHLYVADYELAKVVIADPRLSVRPRTEAYSAISGLDDAPQRVVRGVLANAFSPKALADRAAALQADAARRIGAMAPGDDLVLDVIRPMLLRSASALLSLGHEPVERLLFWYPELARFVSEGAGPDHPVDRSFRASVSALYDRVLSGEDDGFLADLVAVPNLIGTYEAFERVVADLATAVVWSTGNILASAVQALLVYPEVEAALRADRSLFPAFFEEVGRLKTADVMSVRAAREDFDLGGHRIHAGDRVIALAEAANRDPRVFDDPHAFRLGREVKSLSFGHGLRYCTGRYWALEQGAIVVGAVLDAWPDLRAAVGPDAPPLDPYLEVYVTSLPMASAPQRAPAPGPSAATT